MRDFSDVDLAELAEWAEKGEREALDPNLKKAYAAMRQGSDWLIRYRTIDRQRKLEATDQFLTNNTKAARQ